jgi:hypothetical protein
MNSTNSGRRKLLKSLTVGGAAAVTAKSMPEEWTKPLVNGVSLPAHAQTTVPPVSPNFHGGFGMAGPGPLTDLSAPEQIFKSLIDSVIPPALACPCKSVVVEMQQDGLKPTGSNNQEFDVQVAFSIVREGDPGTNIERWENKKVPVGPTVPLTRLSSCVGVEATISIQKTGPINEGTIFYKTEFSSWTKIPYTIGPGIKSLPVAKCFAPGGEGSEGGGQ